MKSFCCSLTIAWLLLAAARLAGAAEPDAILGVWTTDAGTARVEISRRGERYYGSIVQLKEPLHPADPNDPSHYPGHDGEPKMDRLNPDERQRNRPILGLELLRDLQYAGEDVWRGGQIYDPESGRTYRCEITLSAPGQLKVRGFIGISLLGRTTLWTR